MRGLEKVWLLAVLLPACATFPQMARHADPLTPRQHLQLGAVYEAQGQADNAAAQYEAAIKADRKYLPGHLALGNLAFAAGDMAKAETHYRQARRLDPRDAAANNNLAMVYLTVGKNLDKAERYAERALEQGGPLRPYVLETLTELYLREGRVLEARIAQKAAEESAPADNKELQARIAKNREQLPAKLK